MNIIDAIVQGIIQGLTEFLPVSSSGHLSLSQHILGVEMNGSLFFNVMLHLGTLVAVLAVYYKLVWRLICAFCKLVKDIFTGKFRWSTMDYDRRLVLMLIIGLLPLLCFFIPIPGTGHNVKDYFELWATDSDIIIEGVCFLITGVLLTLGIRRAKTTGRRYSSRLGRVAKEKGRMEYTVGDALSVGFMQGFAALPGVSRSGSTLSVALMRGINKQRALDYSFVLGIPAVLAASLLELKDAVSSGAEFETLPILAGVISAAVVGFLAIKLFKWLLATDKLSIFAWYTLILGAAVTVIGIIEKIQGTNLFTGKAL